MSTQSPPNTQSPRPPNTKSHDKVNVILFRSAGGLCSLLRVQFLVGFVYWWRKSALLIAHSDPYPEMLLIMFLTWPAEYLESMIPVRHSEGPP